MTFTRKAIFMPTGLAVCAAAMPSDWDVEIIDECTRDRPHVPRADVDVVGLTAMTTQAPRAYELADGDDQPLMSRVNNVMGVVSPDPAAAMEHLQSALEQAGSDELLRMAAMNNQAHLLARIGNVEAARQLVEEAIELAEQTGRKHQQAALLNHLADIHHQAGREKAAQDALTDAVTLFAGIATGEWEPEVWLLTQW